MKRGVESKGSRTKMLDKVEKVKTSIKNQTPSSNFRSQTQGLARASLESKAELKNLKAKELRMSKEKL